MPRCLGDGGTPILIIEGVLVPDIDSTIAGLEEERRGYERRGLTDRVAQVDAAIIALQPEAAVKAEPRTTAKPSPRARG